MKVIWDTNFHVKTFLSPNKIGEWEVEPNKNAIPSIKEHWGQLFILTMWQDQKDCENISNKC